MKSLQEKLNLLRDQFSADFDPYAFFHESGGSKEHSEIQSKMVQTITVQQMELTSILMQDIIDTNINAHKADDNEKHQHIADYLAYLDQIQSMAALCLTYITDKLLNAELFDLMHHNPLALDLITNALSTIGDLSHYIISHEKKQKPGFKPLILDKLATLCKLLNEHSEQWILDKCAKLAQQSSQHSSTTKPSLVTMRNKFSTAEHHQTVVSVNDENLDGSSKRCLLSMLHFIIITADSLVHDASAKSNTQIQTIMSKVYLPMLKNGKKYETLMFNSCMPSHKQVDCGAQADCSFRDLWYDQCSKDVFAKETSLLYLLLGSVSKAMKISTNP